MARIRTIKPDFWKHEALCEQPEATHMLAAALLNYADDYGYFNANPKLIEGELYPLRKPSVEIPESLRRLQAINYIELGTGPDGRRYGRVVGFGEHQKVSHPTDSKIAILSITWDSSGNIPENLQSAQESFRPEGKGKEGNKERNREGKGRDSAEPSALAPAIVSLPTNRFDSSGEEVGFSQEDLNGYAETYPGVDVPQQFREMRQWLLDNRGRRKTAGGMRRFVNTWLSHEQDRGGSRTIGGLSRFPQAKILKVV